MTRYPRFDFGLLSEYREPFGFSAYVHIGLRLRLVSIVREYLSSRILDNRSGLGDFANRLHHQLLCAAQDLHSLNLLSVERGFIFPTFSYLRKSAQSSLYHHSLDLPFDCLVLSEVLWHILYCLYLAKRLLDKESLLVINQVF